LDRRAGRGFRQPSGRALRSPSVIVAVAVVLVFVVIVLVVVIPVVVVLVVQLLFVILFLVVGTRPALRLLGQFEIEFLPGFVVDFLDIAVFVLQLDEFRVLVDREDQEGLLVFETLVLLSGHRVVIAAHGLPCRRTGRLDGRNRPDITGAGRSVATATPLEGSPVGPQS
jgi:hypothetical protein